MSDGWRDRLEAFFELRARQVSDEPTLEDLCYIAGRNPLVWSDETLLDDLKSSIMAMLNADQRSSILEVGCAAGFLARLVAPNVGKFVGVDMAEAPLTVARRLNLKNATFVKADGERLKFLDGQFDSAFCYDVFSNFPSFEAGEGIILEMLRVVRQRGRVVIGNVPDRAKMDELQSVARDLANRLGSPPEREAITSLIKPQVDVSIIRKILGGLGVGSPSRPPVEITPEAISYYFDREAFIEFGERHGFETQILEIHERNPYVGTRFNAVFAKP